MPGEETRNGSTSCFTEAGAPALPVPASMAVYQAQPCVRGSAHPLCRMPQSIAGRCC